MKLTVKVIYLVITVVSVVLTIIYGIVTAIVFLNPATTSTLFSAYGLYDWKSSGQFVLIYLLIALFSFILYHGIIKESRLARYVTGLIGAIFTPMLPLAVIFSGVDSAPPPLWAIVLPYSLVSLIGLIFIVYVIKPNGQKA